MADNVSTVRSIVTNLEIIQRQIGQGQVELLGILTDESQDEWDEPAQAALVKLEAVQKSIGEVQVLLVEHLPVFSTTERPAPASSRSDTGREGVASVTIEVTQTEFADPQEWLEKRGIKIKSLPAATGIDKSADGAALFLGDNFDALESFYEAIKRAVNREFKEGWYSVEDLPGSTIGAICKLATKLHGCGFLSAFKYVKRNLKYHPNQKPGMRFAPLQEKQVSRFFKGGWLERYVEQVVRGVAQDAFGKQIAVPILREVQVVLPTGCDAEFDLLAGLPENQILWLESKTGEWRQYVTRFQELNKRFLKLPQSDVALVVAERLTEEDKASGSTLSGMTLIHLTELRSHLTLKISPSKRNDNFNHDLRIDKLS